MVCKVWFIGSFCCNKPGFSIILIYWIKKCYNKLKWKESTWSVQKKIYSNIGRCCNKPLFIATCDLHRFCTKWKDAQGRVPLSFHMCDSWFEYPVYFNICTKELSIWQPYTIRKWRTQKLMVGIIGPDRSVSRVTAVTVLPVSISQNPRIKVKTSQDCASDRTIFSAIRGGFNFNPGI